MPSAAAARRRLLAKTAQLETTSAPDPLRAGETWSDLYSFSYHEGLTGCVYQLEQIEMYAKMILGEQGYACMSQGSPPLFFLFESQAFQQVRG